MPLTRRSFVPIGAAAALAPYIKAQNTHRPNILFILLDDIGYGEFGCYGQKQILTPNIDRFARQSIKYTDCYAGGAVLRAVT